MVTPMLLIFFVIKNDSMQDNVYKQPTNTTQMRKLWSPPKLIITAPIMPPDNSCVAPAIPVAVPE